MPLTAPTLAVTDAADGGGGTATLTGGDSGATNTLYYQAVDGDFGGSTWTSAGSRTGAGTITIALSGPGHFWWYVSSTLLTETTPSNFVYQAITDGEEAVLTRAIDAIVARLILLNLDEIGSKVYARPLMDDLSIQWPCAVVVREPTPQQYRGGTNTRDDIGYPIQVLFKVRDQLTPTSPVETYDLWRQSAERAFRFQRLPGIDECVTCEIEPLKILDEKIEPLYANVVSGFTIRVVTREVRGFGA